MSSTATKKPSKQAPVKRVQVQQISEQVQALQAPAHHAGKRAATKAQEPLPRHPKPVGYDGAELRPYQGRPGSLDFLGLPSLQGTRRVYRADHTPEQTTQAPT